LSFFSRKKQKKQYRVVAKRSIRFLDKFGPRELGIYRISGSLAVVDDLKSEFITCHDVDLLENPPVDIHTVSSLLKSWLRGLGERDPLLSDEWRSRICEKCQIDAVTNTPPPNPPQAFVDALSELPPYVSFRSRSCTSLLTTRSRITTFLKLSSLTSAKSTRLRKRTK
jgi:hypothetical protein